MLVRFLKIFWILVLLAISVSSAPPGRDQSAPADSHSNNDRCSKADQFASSFVECLSDEMKKAFEIFFEASREYCDVWDRYYQLEDAYRTVK